jgi:hypothetical protein
MYIKSSGKKMRVFIGMEQQGYSRYIYFTYSIDLPETVSDIILLWQAKNRSALFCESAYFVTTFDTFNEFLVWVIRYNLPAL